MGDFIQNTILPAFMKFVNTRGVRAIKDGMMFSMPLIIVGAVFLLLFQLPIPAAKAFVTSLGVDPFLSHGYTSSFQITAVVTAIGVGYTWAKNDGWEPLSAGIISLALFLILIPDYVGTTINASGALSVTDNNEKSIAAQTVTFEGMGEMIADGTFEGFGVVAGTAAEEAVAQYSDNYAKAMEHVSTAVTAAGKGMTVPEGSAEGLADKISEAAGSAAAGKIKEYLDPEVSSDAASGKIKPAEEIAAAVSDAAIAGAKGAVVYAIDGGTTGSLNKTWLAGQGMIGAMIAGMLAGLVYSWFLAKDIRIKMPDGVPDGVAAAFTGLIPAAVILTGGVVIFGLCMKFAGATPIDLIYKWLQTPLQNVGDSLPGVILFEFLIPLFWFFGVHGATVVGSVASPISQANQLENAAIFQKLTEQGMSRSEAIAALPSNGGHIFTEAFQNCFQAPTGSGWTIGLVVFMLVFAKSEQMKKVGQLGIGAGIFNINEPVLFGTPIVLNPKLIVPFIATPVIINAAAYILTDIGFIPMTMGVTVPWTTPPILSGLIVCGWQGALVQAAGMVLSFFLYTPFARSVDQEYLEAEQAADAA